MNALMAMKRTRVVSHYNHNEHYAQFAVHVFAIGVVGSTHQRVNLCIYDRMYVCYSL